MKEEIIALIIAADLSDYQLNAILIFLRKFINN